MRKLRSGLLVLSFASTVAGCSLIVTGEAKGGIGAPCTEDAQCNGTGAMCLPSSVTPSDPNGICSLQCNFDTECPAPSKCINQQCQTWLTAGIAMTGFPGALEGWTVAHNDSLQAANGALGYLMLEKKFGLIPGNVLSEVKDLASRNQVVFGNTVEYGDDFVSAARLFPDKSFLVANNGVRYDYPGRSANFSTYWVHREQAWYIAGKVAAAIGKKRLGVISAVINPDCVRDVNAFTLGARSVNPNIVVEVRHIGFWSDTNTSQKYYTQLLPQNYSYYGYREEYLAGMMWSSGVEVIAHLGNTQRSVKLIDWLTAQFPTNPTKVWTFANDVKTGCEDSAGAFFPTCIGSIYENWTPIYTRIFDQIHRSVYTENTVEMDIDGTDNSPVGVSINPKGPGDDLATRALMQALAESQSPSTRYRVFTGPYDTNGQRDKDGDGIPDSTQKVLTGEIISDTELARMCWFVKGVVEKTKLNDPRSVDRDALVPGGLVPGSSTPNMLQAYVTESEDRLVLPTGVSAKCKENSF